MSADRDYMVGVGMELASDAVETISTQIETALRNVPALQLKVSGLADLERMASLLQTITSNGGDTSRAISNVSQAINSTADSLKAQRQEISDTAKANADYERASASFARDQFNERVRLNNELERSLQLYSRMNDEESSGFVGQGVRDGRRGFPSAADNFNSDMFNGASVDDLMARGRTMAAAVQGVMATVQDQVDQTLSREGSINDAIRNVYPEQSSSGAGANVTEEYTRGMAQYAVAQNAMNAQIERNSSLIDNNVGQLKAAIAAHEQMRAALPPEIAEFAGLGDQLGHQLITFAEWAAMAKVVEGAVNLVTKSVHDSLASQREQVFQSMYYQEQGQSFTPSVSNEALSQSMALARLYGEDVMHVQEAVGLWAKQSKGELEPALVMTNSALKLNAVSGMDLEEIYKSTVGILAQTHDSYARQNDLYNVATGLALKYGGALQSLEGQNDDMVKQMMEGMDKSSAIFAKAGLHMEEMGAAVAVTSQNLNELGSSAGASLARAFAQLEEGGPRKALHDLGIETENNVHLIQDLQRVFPQIGAELTSKMRPGDKETFVALMSNAKQYAEALQEAKKAEDEMVLDQSMAKVMQTTSFELGQLKAGWESLGITLAREFQPQIQGTVSGLLNLVPVLLDNTKLIGDFVAGAVQIALVVGGFNVLRTVVATTARTFIDAREAYAALRLAFDADARAAIAFQSVMDTSLTGYQRALLSTATTSGTVSAELEANIKTVAATTGASIDQVILKYMQMTGAVSTTATSVEASDAAMESAVAGLGRAAGTTAVLVDASGNAISTAMVTTEGAVVTSTDAMKAGFAGLATTAETDFAAIGAAAFRMLPVIGLVVSALILVSQGLKAVSDAKDAAEEAHLRADPSYMKQQFSKAVAPVQNTTFVERMGEIPTTGVHPTDPHELELINAVQQGNDPGAEFTKQLDQIQKDAEKRQKEFEDQMKKLYAAQGGAATDVMPAGTSTSPTAVQESATALDQIKTINDTILEQDKAKVALDGAAVDKAKEKLATQQLTLAGVQALGNAYNQEHNDVQKEITDSQKVVDGLSKTHDDLMSQAQAAGGMGTKAGEGFIKQADAIQRAADAAKAHIADLQKQLQALDDAHMATILGYQEKLVSLQTAGLKNTYNQDQLGLTSEGKLASVNDLEKAAQDANAYATTLQNIAKQYQNGGAAQQAFAQHLNDEAQTVQKNAQAWDQRAEAIKQNDTNLTTNLQAQIQDQQIELAAPWDDHLQGAMKSVIDLERTYASDMTTLMEADDTAGEAMLNTWAQNQAQIIQNKAALEEYTTAVNNLKQSAMYSAFSSAITDAGSTLATNMVNNIDGTTSSNNQILALQNQVQSLENERNLLVGKYYDVQRTEMGNQINELNDKIKQLQEIEKNPSLGKKLMEDLTKGMIDSLMKELEDKLKQGFIDQFIPKLDDSTQKQKQSIDEFQKVVNGQLKQSFDQWKDAWDKGAPAMDRLSNALDQFNQANSNTSPDSNTLPGILNTYNGLATGDIPMSPDTSQMPSGSAASSSSSNFESYMAMGGHAVSGGSSLSSIALAAAPLAGIALSAFSASGNPNAVPVGSGSGYVNPDGTPASGPDIYSVPDNTAIDPSQLTGLGNQAAPPAAGKGIGAGNVMGALGDGMMAYQGVQQGGVSGGLEAGLGTFEGLSQFGVPPQIALPVAGAVALYAAFSHHDNPALMPDKYDTATWGQDNADWQGSGQGSMPVMNANGQQFTMNSSLYKELGNQGELSYIAQFMQNNPQMAAQLLTPQELSMFSGLKQGAGDIINGKNGNLELQNGQWVNWQQLATSVNDAVSAIQNFTNNAYQATQPLIAIQAFGGNGSATGFSPYYTPGFGQYYSDYMKNSPYYAAYASPTNANAGANGTSAATSTGSGAAGVGSGGGVLKIQSNLVLGSRTIAQIVQNVRYQQTQAGWQLS